MGMRRLISGLQISLDGKIGGPDGYADWVDEWSDHYEVIPRVDACLLGAHMYPGYEQYWTAIHSKPTEPTPMTGKLPTPAETEYARFAARTPHYVLSSTLGPVSWPHTTILRNIEQVTALKQQSGKDIYLVGGARIVASLLDAGLVDELRLTVHPLVIGQGLALFAESQLRRSLELQHVRQLDRGRVGLLYAVG
jgi:dihydrofolate reductase